uniref:Secreted peptide n=1 Tax=Helianthus annuus TaxID=4232 RepID=A0A251V115_HELAN
MLNLNGVILSSLLLRFTLLNTPTNAQAVEVDSSLGCAFFYFRLVFVTFFLIIWRMLYLCTRFLMMLS